MRENWLSELYQNIKKARDGRLAQALILLHKKAASDPEIAEAVRLLRPWMPGRGQEDETTSNG